MQQILSISGSPHIHSPRSTDRIMWMVIIALMPALACSLYCFGLGAAIVTAGSVLVCLVTEYVISRYMLGRRTPVFSVSAVLTGLLLAFNLPSNLPLWIVAIGGVVAIGVGKMAFGGLGCNIFNPALVGRVFLLLSFPAQMTSWPLPGADRMSYVDVSTGATLLSSLKTGDVVQMDLMREALGFTGGSLGEVGAVALLIGATWLLVTRVVTWHVPVAILSTVTLFALAIGSDVAVELLGGGLLLGAFFMATDYVTSPMTHRGMIIYGVMIGVITVVIRHWGAYPEGVSFAILIMNGVTPLINRYVRPRRFGERRRAYGC